MTSSNNANSGNCGNVVVSNARQPAHTEQEEQTQIPDGLYPNPTKEKLMVHTGSTSISENNITVVDAAGRSIALLPARVMAASLLEINVAALKPGVYILKLKMEGGYKTFRFVKL
jgi:hypothetical protein